MTPCVSVCIPSRNERFLGPTVVDVLAKARGDLEVLVCLDGYWPTPPLPDDPRIRILQRGTAQGMRPALNSLARMARGTYLMKLDAHCLVAEGFDVTLAADCADNWIVVPRRYALDPEAWAIDTSNSKYPIDYHYLSFPWEAGADPAKVGLHGTPWTERRKARWDDPASVLDDEMSSQGSCWFMHRDHWARLGEMEIAHYGNFIHEFQELGMKTWLGGGAVKVNKRTSYAHLYKGSRYGRGYAMGQNNHRTAMVWCVRHWMFDQWPDRVRDLAWLVEKFWPVPGWPANWPDVVAAKRVEMQVPVAPSPAPRPGRRLLTVEAE